MELDLFERDDNVISCISALKLSQEDKIPAGGKDEAIDKQKAAELINEIKPLLEIYKSLNEQQIKMVNEILSPVGKQCERLVSFLEEFDLELALDTLKKIEVSLFHGTI